MSSLVTHEVVAIGSDHAGFALKTALVAHLEALGFEQILDLGPGSADRVDYPDYGQAVGHAIIEGRARFGILICGTGIGISIAANKVPGIRAALVHDDVTARMARAHNDAQIVCIGARVVGDEVAKSIVEQFLSTAFEGGRHAGRVAKIHTPERA
ncbi:MAG: ribose 5-phosphate isomerase B [Bradymonadia bacterium]